MNVCYHKSCDDERFLTTSNLLFMKHTIDTLVKVVTSNVPKFKRPKMYKNVPKTSVGKAKLTQCRSR